MWQGRLWEWQDRYRPYNTTSHSPFRSDLDLDSAPVAKKPCDNGASNSQDDEDSVDFSMASLAKGDVVKVSGWMGG